jgi:CRP-like cAMP-binding protein
VRGVRGGCPRAVTGLGVGRRENGDMIAGELSSSPLLAGCGSADLDSFAEHLESRRLDPGDRLMREGEAGTFFALLVSGQVAVTRDGPIGPEQLAVVGGGSVIGELALLRDMPRTATVTATVPTVALTGDAEAFALLLDLPGVRERIERVVSARLAAVVPPVLANLQDGTPILLRPLLPSDRDGIAAALREMSAESLHRRFFSGGQPTERVIDYLVSIDYINHFAWLVLDARMPTDGWATARYIRRRDIAKCAELAFAVKDAHQGRGLGSLLLGAIGAAASVGGIRDFTATLLSDNAPMRAVLAKANATFAFDEPGVTRAELSVQNAISLLGDALRRELQNAARDVVTAARLALTHVAES